jgi:hypothetical protein
MNLGSVGITQYDGGPDRPGRLSLPLKRKISGKVKTANGDPSSFQPLRLVPAPLFRITNDSCARFPAPITSLMTTLISSKGGDVEVGSGVDGGRLGVGETVGVAEGVGEGPTVAAGSGGTDAPSGSGVGGSKGSGVSLGKGIGVNVGVLDGMPPKGITNSCPTWMKS